MFIIIIAFIVIFLIVLLIRTKSGKSFNDKMYGINQLGFQQEVPYWRGIPFTSLSQAYFVGTLYGLVQNPSDFIGALLLKWVKENRITIIKKDDKIYFDMNKVTKFEDKYESKIYLKLLASSGSNYLLEQQEFVNFFKTEDTIDLLRNIFGNIEDDFVNSGVFKKEVVGTTYKYFLDENLEKKAYEMAGLKKFLLNFSKIQDKNSEEVILWEDYLIYAQLMGIADKVQDQFAEFYPNYNHIVEFNIMKQSVFVSLKDTFRIMSRIISINVR